MSREYTRRMLELLEEGSFNEDVLIRDLLNFLSEAEVEEFVRHSDFVGFEDLGFDPDAEDSDLEPEADIYGDSALEEEHA